jgi:hypothetical protein
MREENVTKFSQLGLRQKLKRAWEKFVGKGVENYYFF